MSGQREVFALRCGATHHNEAALFKGRALRHREFPSWVLVIRGPRADGKGTATVLVDTGYRAGTWHTGWKGWVYRRLVPPAMRPELTAAAQLSARGIDLSTVTHIVLTHLHPDHVGGLVDFPHAKLVVSQGTAALAQRSRLRDGVLTGLLPESFPGADAVVIHPSSLAEREWPGLPGPPLKAVELCSLDPSIVPDVWAVDLPGHAAGHPGVMVGERLLHAGDAAWSSDLVDCTEHMRALPKAITWNHGEVVATAAILAAARDAGITVTFSHDHDVAAAVSRAGWES